MYPLYIYILFDSVGKDHGFNVHPYLALLFYNVFQITVSSSPDGGSVMGVNLWRVIVFMSSTPDGQGERFFEADANTGNAGSAALPAGGTIEMDSVAAPLALDGFSCATTQYLCHEFTRSDAASVDFTLEAASTLPNGLINCQQNLCRG